AKGKPLLHHLMNEDLKNAYLYAMSEADNKTQITLEFLKNLNARVMAQTGGPVESIGGSFDSSKGEFRKVNVFARGGSSYMDYKKVLAITAGLCLELEQRLLKASSLQEKYNLSFDAHYNLVTIHPWADGNGRTSRLLMNYIQFYYGITPSKVYQQDRAEYIEALKKSQEGKSNTIFLHFMAKQLLKSLKEEIRNFEKSQKKSNDFSIMFY
ncbi:MAG: Fic family protein, partial [Firmicutes bacterium]|nr:Fic family protein [Bacillota bacterium]